MKTNSTKNYRVEIIVKTNLWDAFGDYHEIAYLPGNSELHNKQTIAVGNEDFKQLFGHFNYPYFNKNSNLHNLI